MPQYDPQPMPEPSPRVGVVVLNYRGADDTLRCLGSLAAAGIDEGVVVVDNASDDGSVEAIGEAFPTMTLVVNEDNLGFAAGCDRGIACCLEDGAEFVWVLNNDTTVEPATLPALLVAAADPRAGAVGAVIYDMAETERVLTWGGGRVGRWTGFTRDARGPGDRLDYLTGASLLLRATALDDVGSFDPRYFFTWEDVDLGLRLRRGGWRLVVAPDARVWHRWGGSAAPLGAVRMEHHANGLVRFMRSHSPVPVLTALPMLGWYALGALRQRDAGLWRAAWHGWMRGWRS
jgi:GT2 family glycosyltransferase